MKLLKFILLVVIVSISFLSIIVGLYRQGQNRFLKVKNPIKEMLYGHENYDILFIGSSRTTMHVNPRFIDSITNLNSYNAGQYGANIIEMNLMLQSYLEKHIPPKLVVADFSINSFNIDQNPIYSPVDYFPYVNNETVYNVVSKYHKRARLWKYLPFMEICEASEMQKVQAVVGLFGKKETLGGYKGYKENGVACISPDFKFEDTLSFKVMPKALNILHQLILTCKQNDIQLLFTYSPEFYLLHHKAEDNFFKAVNSVCEENQIPLLNYKHHYICKQNTFFLDPIHLNTKGATAFSISLAQVLSNQLRLSKEHSNNIYYTQNNY